jgi:hypothetical protein
MTFTQMFISGEKKEEPGASEGLQTKKTAYSVLCALRDHVYSSFHSLPLAII